MQQSFSKSNYKNLSKKNKYGVIVLASATDPYLQIEKDTGLTRKLLEVILKYRFPVHVITKSDLVVRDFDLLKQIDKSAFLPLNLKGKINRGVFITFSFSTLDDAVAKVFEPGATSPSKRLEMLQQTSAAGFHCGVSMMPLLPFISDTEEQMDRMLSAFKKAGAKYVFPASLTLFGQGPADSKTLVFRVIEKYYPQLMERYKNLFAGDFRIDSNYQREFSDRSSRLLNKHGIKNRIV